MKESKTETKTSTPINEATTICQFLDMSLANYVTDTPMSGLS